MKACSVLIRTSSLARKSIKAAGNFFCEAAAFPRPALSHTFQNAAERGYCCGRARAFRTAKRAFCGGFAAAGGSRSEPRRAPIAPISTNAPQSTDIPALIRAVSCTIQRSDTTAHLCSGFPPPRIISHFPKRRRTRIVLRARPRVSHSETRVLRRLLRRRRFTK